MTEIEESADTPSRRLLLVMEQIQSQMNPAISLLLRQFFHLSNNITDETAVGWAQQIRRICDYVEFGHENDPAE